MHDGRCTAAGGPKSGDSSGAHRPASTRQLSRRLPVRRPTGAPAALGGSTGAAVADRPPAHRTRHGIDRGLRHARRSMHLRWRSEIGRFAWHASARVDSPAVRRRPVRRPTGALAARRPTGALAVRRPAGALAVRRPAGALAVRRATGALAARRPTGALAARRPTCAPGGRPRAGGSTGLGGGLGRPPLPAHRIVHDVDRGRRHARRSMRLDQRPEIGRFARHASANVDPSAAPRRPVRRATGAPVVSGGSTSSAVADRPSPPAHRTPNGIDLGVRYAPRSMRLDRRPEISQFARYISANVDPSAAPRRPARRPAGAPAARSRLGGSIGGSAVAWAGHRCRFTASSTTSIEDLGTYDGRCTPTAGPKSGDSPGTHRPTSTRRPPRTDRRDAQPAHRRPDPGRATQPRARRWPTDHRHPVTAPPNDIDQGLRHIRRSMHPDRRSEIR
jgi:hypothetical protein